MYGAITTTFTVASVTRVVTVVASVALVSSITRAANGRGDILFGPLPVSQPFCVNTSPLPVARCLHPLHSQAEDARQIKIASPVLNAKELQAIEDLPGFKTVTLPTVYALEKGPGGLQVRQPDSRGEGMRGSP